MPACPVCQSPSPSEAWQYNEYQVLACPNCDLQFVYPMLGANADFYTERYQTTIAAMRADDIHPGFRFTVRKIKSVAQNYLEPSRRRAIDIGCGPGYLLSELTKLGFDALGIDFNPDVVRVAQEHFHVKAHVGDVAELIRINARFDLALLIHVLEHVPDPAHLLRDISLVLERGGILLIDLPNRERFAFNRSIQKGTFFWGEYPPHHITFWSVKALSAALELAGYTVLECVPRPLGEEGQIKIFLKNRLKLPDQLAESLALPLRAMGRRAGLQGETIYAIARRN